MRSTNFIIASGVMALQADSRMLHGIGPRTVSALVFASVVVAFAYMGGLGFELMVAMAAVLMGYEWSRLCNDGAMAIGAAVAAGGAAPVAVAALAGADVAVIAAAAAAAVIYAVAWATGARRLWSAAGVVYISIPCIVLVWLRAAPALGLETVFWLFAVVWATDTGAYFAGRGIGGPKLAPRISPQKTWAGLAGGVICAAAVGILTAALLDIPNPAPIVLFSAVLAFVAQAGDLGESMVKRHFGVKDSGRLIPGHGGVLDRLDGLMTAAPAVAASVILTGEGVLAWR